MEVTEQAVVRRLMEFRAKMHPSLLRHVKQLEASKQPTSVEEMYDVIQRWADGERAGAGGRGGGHHDGGGH